MVLTSATPNKYRGAMIEKLADALLTVLSDTDLAYSEERDVLWEYDQMFKRKPDVRCICKVCVEARKDGENPS